MAIFDLRPREISLSSGQQVVVLPNGVVLAAPAGAPNLARDLGGVPLTVTPLPFPEWLDGHVRTATALGGGRLSDKTDPNRHYDNPLTDGWHFLMEDGRAGMGVQVRILRPGVLKASGPGDYLDVVEYDAEAPGHVLTFGADGRPIINPIGHRRPQGLLGPQFELTAELEYELAEELHLASGKKDWLIEFGGVMYAAFEMRIIPFKQWEWVVGIRNMQRSLMEPLYDLVRNDRWGREDVDKLWAAWGPNINPDTARNIRYRAIAMLATGIPYRPANPEMLLRAHRPGREHVGSLFEMALQLTVDRIDSFEVLTAGPHAGRVGLEVTGDYRKKWQDALYNLADGITEKRLRKEFRSGRGSSKLVLDTHAKGFYMQSVGWVRPWILTGADWNLGPVMRYTEAERLGHRDLVYGWSESGQPELAFWLVKGLLEDIYKAMVSWIIARNRDPKPWKELAESSLWSLTSPDFRYQIVERCLYMAQMGPILDEDSRTAEGLILRGLTSSGHVDKDSPGDRRKRQVVELVTAKKIPASSVLGDEWGRILANAPRQYKAELATIWEATKDLLWSEPWSLTSIVLSELRHVTYGGVWNRLADEFEGRVRRLVRNEEVNYYA